MTDNWDAELLRLGERLRKVMREVAVKRAAYEELEERITAAVDRSAPTMTNWDGQPASSNNTPQPLTILRPRLEQPTSELAAT